MIYCNLGFVCIARAVGYDCIALTSVINEISECGDIPKKQVQRGNSLLVLGCLLDKSSNVNINDFINQENNQQDK